MSRLQSSFVLAALLVASRLASAASAGEEAGWTDLLAGDALQETWRGYNAEASPDSWRLEEGVLTLGSSGDHGTGGDLVTREEYGDFDFQFEWKVAPQANSGVMYRVGETAGPPYETGPEYQVIDPAFNGLTEHNSAASLYGLYPVPISASKPAGEWNTGRIVLKEGAVEHWINGQKVVEAVIGSEAWNRLVAGGKFADWPQYAKLPKGRLALQDHGGGVWYRNLRVKRLDAPAQAATGGKRLLFVTQSAGFKHSTVTRQPHELSHCERVLTELGVRSGSFRVDCTQDVEADFTPELLKNYDVVAFFTTGELPIPMATREWFLKTWLAEEGHGFLGVHAAADTYAEYQPYWDMVGGTFDGHPWTSEHDVVLQVHADDHPAAKPWGPAGTRIALKEEIYQFKNWQPEKVRVLMSLDMAKTPLKAPRHVPVLWVKDYGKGRVLHMSLGHREDVWTNPQYQDSLIGGVKWLLGDVPGDATPNPELSAAQQKLAEEAAAAQPAAAG